MVSLSDTISGSAGAGHRANTPSAFDVNVTSFAGRLSVVSFRGTERLSKAYSFEILVTVVEERELFNSSLLGKPATLTLAVAEGPPRVVAGVVAAIEPDSGKDLRADRFRVRLVPRLWLLKKHVTSRILQHLTVPQIACLVLAQAEVPHRFSLTRPYAQREYCVQYQESDYDFVRRILAEEGSALEPQMLKPLRFYTGGMPR